MLSLSYDQCCSLIQRSSMSPFLNFNIFEFDGQFVKLYNLCYSVSDQINVLQNGFDSLTWLPFYTTYNSSNAKYFTVKQLDLNNLERFKKKHLGPNQNTYQNSLDYKFERDGIRLYQENHPEV